MSQTRKRKSAAARRAEIVDTAIRLSAELGPDRVTTQHLADAVGVTQPAIFRHFASKTAIWEAVAEHIVSQVETLRGHEITVAEGNPHDQLHQLVGHHFVHIEKNPAIPAILFSRELQASSEPLRSKFSAFMKSRGDEIAGLIQSAQAAGLHRAEIAADDAAQLVTAAVQGLSLRWLLENRAFDLTAEGGRVIGGLIDGFRA